VFLSPLFDWDNWTSTINGQVLVHPDYAGRLPWSGRIEQSDLRFKDEEGMLTRRLIREGYLDRNIWSEANPEYYIEVKTTTRAWSDNFFMSGKQYRMVSLHFQWILL
jgi:hypothetical protein